MKHLTRRSLTLAASALCLSWLPGAHAQAQAFPNKPVRLVVTYPAGGSSDLMARIMGQKPRSAKAKGSAPEPVRSPPLSLTPENRCIIKAAPFQDPPGTPPAIQE